MSHFLVDFQPPNNDGDDDVTLSDDVTLFDDVTLSDDVTLLVCVCGRDDDVLYVSEGDPFVGE